MVLYKKNIKSLKNIFFKSKSCPRFACKVRSEKINLSCLEGKNKRMQYFSVGEYIMLFYDNHSLQHSRVPSVRGNNPPYVQ